MANQFLSWTAEDISVLRRVYPYRGAAITAKQLGRSESAVNSFASRLGVHYVLQRDRVDADRIRTLAHSGSKVLDISKALGVSKITIWKACTHHGIRLRDLQRDYYWMRRSATGKKLFLLYQIRKYTAQKDFSKCCICGWRRSSPDLAHILAAANGGTYTINNIVPLCPNHHRLFDLGRLMKKEKALVVGFSKKFAQLAAKGRHRAAVRRKRDASE